MTSDFRGVWAALVVAIPLGCGSAEGPVVSTPPPGIDNGLSYVPADTWRVVTLKAAGFDSAAMVTLKQDVVAGKYGGIQGLVIIRYGYLVDEQYLGWARGNPHAMQSVSKSVTSLLYGIVTNGGSATAGNLDSGVLSSFGRYAPVANLDRRKTALTFRSLLTMRTGMDFWEQPYDGSPLDQLNRSSGDWTRFILDRPMVADPGGVWAYNSGAAILTCSALRELTNENPADMARRVLFGPIGVTGDRWFRSPFDSLPHCGGGLYLKPVDLARVGYLVLRGGRWGDTQVVPAAWITLSTHAVTHGQPVFFSDYGSGYGYFWWLFPSKRGLTDDAVIAASGSGGQWLFVIPSLDLVVAIVASDGDGLSLLYEGLLPAVTQ